MCDGSVDGASDGDCAELKTHNNNIPNLFIPKRKWYLDTSSPEGDCRHYYDPASWSGTYRTVSCWRTVCHSRGVNCRPMWPTVWSTTTQTKKKRKKKKIRTTTSRRRRCVGRIPVSARRLLAAAAESCVLDARPVCQRRTAEGKTDKTDRIRLPLHRRPLLAVGYVANRRLLRIFTRSRGKKSRRRT